MKEGLPNDLSSLLVTDEHLVSRESTKYVEIHCCSCSTDSIKNRNLQLLFVHEAQTGCVHCQVSAFHISKSSSQQCSLFVISTDGYVQLLHVTEMCESGNNILIINILYLAVVMLCFVFPAPWQKIIRAGLNEEVSVFEQTSELAVRSAKCLFVWFLLAHLTL